MVSEGNFPLLPRNAGFGSCQSNGKNFQQLPTQISPIIMDSPRYLKLDAQLRIRNILSDDPCSVDGKGALN